MSVPFLSNLDLNQNELQNARIQNLASDPGSPVKGQIWVNSTTNLLKWYDGTTVQVIADLNNTLNQFAAPTADLSINSHKLTNVTDPTSAQDAATKAYVDSVAVGLDVHASCRLATAAALPAYGYVSGVITETGNGALSVDGVTPSVGDRILLKDGAAGSDNGIYVVTTVGSAGTQFVLTRASDCNTSTNYQSGAFTFIEQGTANQGYGYVVSTQGTITVGTTSVSWVKFSATSGSVNKFASTLSSGSTTYTVTHSLGTTDVIVQVWESAGSKRQIDVEIQIIDANSVSVVFAATTGANYRCVVTG